MHFNFQFTGWDLGLLIAVSVMGALVAYLHHPKWKSLILSLPIPFTLACLSLGPAVNVNATHVAGSFLLILYTYGVRWLYVGVGLPIVAAIGISAGGYALLGLLLGRALPESEGAFWAAAVLVFLAALLAVRLTPQREEPGHRTSLPLWIKLPIIVGVVCLLIVCKQMLRGFMTQFPMVGIVASYEARHCLWTISRAIPLIVIWLLPAMAVIHVLQPRVGQGVALTAGWLVYLAFLLPVAVKHWRSSVEEIEEGL
jgi:hypothetical protein